MTNDGKIESGDIVSSNLLLKAMTAFYNRFKNTINLPRTFDLSATATCGQSNNHAWGGIAYRSTIVGTDVLTIPLDWYKPLKNAELIKPSGLIQISDIYTNLNIILECFLNIRYIKAYWYHNQLDGDAWGTYVLKDTKEGYQNVNKGPIDKPKDPNPIKPGDQISAKGFNDKLDAIYDSWKANIETAGVVETSAYTCHYVCHYNYDNRVRR